MNRPNNGVGMGDLFVPQLQGENVEAEEDADAVNRNADLDGGVAGNVSDSTEEIKRAADCELVLYVTCSEDLSDIAPDHPVLRQGVTVSIGLAEKTTKLSAVFARYTEFCNEHSDHKIDDSDIEFVHCQLLNGNSTAETSALMKNDKIKVRRERSAEREAEAELSRIRKETDRSYFEQMRAFLPDSGSVKSMCDIILDCRGKHVDESGRSQKVLRTTISANSVLLSKRCPWLGRLIGEARKKESEARRRNSITVPQNIVNGASDDDSPPTEEYRARNIPPSLEPDDDDDEVGVYSVAAQNRNDNERALVANSEAAEIENDDDDDDDQHHMNQHVNFGSSQREGVMNDSISSLPILSADSRHHHLWVTLPYTLDAVKLLLEYCYTNRVIALGQSSNSQACKTDSGHSFSGWPKNAQPTITFSVAIAGIALAEEAGMHRLSLMCEAAASQLLQPSNVADALCMCTSQDQLTGNPLPRLRERAMNLVLRGRPSGLFASPIFQRALKERSEMIVPSLISGTLDAITAGKKKKLEVPGSSKRDYSAIAECHFAEIDRDDRFKREKERRVRRSERLSDSPNVSDDYMDFVVADTVSSSWEDENTRRTLKRMSRHMVNVGFTLGDHSLYSRDIFHDGSLVRGRKHPGSRRRTSES